MLTKAKIKTAEEITGVKKCTCFFGDFFSYTVNMRPEEPNKTYTFEKIEDVYYDYQRTDTTFKYKYKKEWLKDIVEEIDWSKVPVDAKCLVSNNNEIWHHRHFSHVNKDGIPEFFFEGRTSWSSDKIVPRSWNYYKLAEEK